MDTATNGVCVGPGGQIVAAIGLSLLGLGLILCWVAIIRSRLRGRR